MTRCHPCSDYRKTLSAMVQRVKELDVDLSSYSKFTPNINLNKSQLKSKTSNYAQEIKLLKQQRDNLLKKVKSVVEKESVELSPELEDVVLSLGINDNHPFDVTLRKVFYGKNKRSRHCCRKRIEAEQCVGTL